MRSLDRGSRIQPRRVGTLLAQLGEIDLFVRDGRHFRAKPAFELTTLRVPEPGSVLVADDVDLDCRLHWLIGSHPGQQWCVCHAEPLRPIRTPDDRGIFGVIRTNSDRLGVSPRRGSAGAAFGDGVQPLVVVLVLVVVAREKHSIARSKRSELPRYPAIIGARPVRA